MDKNSKPLLWLQGEVKTPPFSEKARIEVGLMLRRLQEGEMLGLPHSRPMPNIGKNCHELRIKDKEKNWRVIYRLDHDAILIVEVFNKTTRTTPNSIILNCKKRLSEYDLYSQE
jgi:phage-related protein